MDLIPRVVAAVTGTGADDYVPGHGDRSFDVRSYDLDLDYRVDGNRLVGEAVLEVVVREPGDRLELDLHGLQVDKVLVDGSRPARFAHRAGRLRIRLAAPAAADDVLRVVVRYSGRPGPLGTTWGEVGWEELSDGVLVAGQPSGAPSWFPCNDRPDDKASYRLRVTTGSAYAVRCNGELVERTRRASRTTWVFEQREPMSTYLATVQVGRYAEHELPGSAVPQRVLAPPSLSGAVQADLARQPAMLDAFVRMFGPYPFTSYTVVVTADDLEIPLEAQTLSVFGRNHLDGTGRMERLVAHELAHQWFGNSLTVAGWSDIWLHEGFACYAEWLWSEASGGEDADTHARRHHLRLAQEPQDLLLAAPGPDLMFDDRLYKRGALALHAVRLHLGDDRFFVMLRDWVSRYRAGTVTTRELEDHIATHGATRDVLRPWVHERELPSL